jgi:hypothetical protein
MHGGDGLRPPTQRIPLQIAAVAPSLVTVGLVTTVGMVGPKN